MHVYSAASVDWHFPLFVAYGVTGVLNLHTTANAPLDLVRMIKARLAAGELVGPRFVANGPIPDGEPPAWASAIVARTAEEGRVAVETLARGGADFIKTYDNLPLEAYVAIADGSKRRGIPLLGHVPFAVTPELAASSGHLTDEHMTGIESGCSRRSDAIRAERQRTLRSGLPGMELMVAVFKLERTLYDSRDPALCAATAQTYRRHGTMVVPNLVIHRNSNAPREVMNDAESMKYIPARQQKEWNRIAGPGPGEEIRQALAPTWAARLENVRMLRDAGVPILAGTDVGNAFLVPGLSLHQELALLVEAGLTPLESLQAATDTAARALDASETQGTIASGKRADPVLLDANPLDDIRNTRRIRSLVLNGRCLDRAALDRLLAGVEATARSDEAIVAEGVWWTAPGGGDVHATTGCFSPTRATTTWAKR